MEENKIAQMKELVSSLSQAAKAYYQESREIISNFEYDKLYDQLTALEKETGVVLAGSPTQKVGYEVLSELPKEPHPSPMLSLDKTKEVPALQEWLGDQEGLLSWKLDGLTVVLTYEGGNLRKAVTRGNGEIGEVITNNAKTFENIPLKIAFTGQLVLRGEAVIRYSDFEKMNEEIEDVDARYKNPRNLCSGSVRQLNSQITAKRHVNCMIFALVSAEGMDFENSRSRQFAWLKSQGFEVVEHQMVTAQSLPDKVKYFADTIQGYDIPSDGLVLTFEDIAYGESLGRTAKFPDNQLIQLTRQFPVDAVHGVPGHIITQAGHFAHVLAFLIWVVHFPKILRLRLLRQFRVQLKLRRVDQDLLEDRRRPLKREKPQQIRAFQKIAADLQISAVLRIHEMHERHLPLFTGLQPQLQLSALLVQDIFKNNAYAHRPQGQPTLPA